MHIIWDECVANLSRCDGAMNITRRKMPRRIVGWVRVPEGNWPITMKRMTERVSRALIEWENKLWSERIYLMQWNYVCRVRFLLRTSWVVLSCKWDPKVIPDASICVLIRRPRGRFFFFFNGMHKSKCTPKLECVSRRPN